MKKFIVIYHAPAEAVAQMTTKTPKEQTKGMKPWLDWKESLGDHLVDFGTPLMSGIRLLPDGTSEMSTKEVTGYSIIQAESMDEAKDLLKNHPHLAWTGGCDIEIHECMPM
jgi:hypothetical protein